LEIHAKVKGLFEKRKKERKKERKKVEGFFRLPSVLDWE